MDPSEVVALAAVALLALAHVVAPMLRFVRFVPRSAVLSAAGGVSVAYVFVHLLPEVADAQAAVDDVTGWLESLERHAYVAALAGLVAFYGLERAAIGSRRRREAGGADVDQQPTSTAAFWVSAAAFAFYNGIIGYLVVRRAEQSSNVEVAIFAIAIGLHFVVNDLGLRAHHRRRYDRYGRPLLAGAILAGWVVGTVVELSEPAVGLAVAFLAGAIVLNVMKEELPQERESRFAPLAMGAATYGALLLAV